MEYGWDKERFPSLTGDQFDCLICQQVVKNPKECSGCGSLFCSSCIDSWMQKKNGKECPNRCNASQNKIQKLTSRALLRIYNDLDIKCKFAPTCSKIIKLGDIEAHEAVCQIPNCSNNAQCQNKALSGQTECSPACQLTSQVKACNNNVSQMYKVIQDFLKDYQKPQICQVVQPQLGKQQSQVVVQQVGNQTFRWSTKCKGTGIELSNDNLFVWLKETAYMFRTLLGDTAFNSGVHYWELTADDRTENELKIGVSTKLDFNYNSAFCDFEFGFAYYGLGQLRYNSNASGGQYGKRFKKEGVLGCCLNMNKGTLSFALNGEYFGTAYQHEALKKGPIYPAVSLLHCAGCKLDSSKPIPAYFPL